MTTDRPKGGRRPEDFPEVRTRDQKILDHLFEFGPSSRNHIAAYLNLESTPRLVTYALHRLRFQKLVHRVPRGNEGHGVWAVTQKAEQERRS